MSQKELGKKDNVSLDDALEVLNNERHRQKEMEFKQRHTVATTERLATPWVCQPPEDPGNILSIFSHKIVISDTRLSVAFRLGDAQWMKSLLHKHADLRVGPWHRVRSCSSV